MIFWLLQWKKRFWVSFIVLLIAYFHFHAFLEWSNDVNPNIYDRTLKLFSYNVRLFNAYEKNSNQEEVGAAINKLIRKEGPEVLCIQEYYDKNKVDFSEYPYQFIHFRSKSAKMGHAIFSKYPIINKGSFDFDGTFNNTIWIDLLIEKDTVRVYNLHLESLGILPSVEFLQDKGADSIRKKLRTKFIMQEQQVNAILEHSSKIQYASIVAGDFNNTSFSYVYNKMMDGRQDGFQEKGNGLGSTFNFNGYPMRIDFILPSNHIEVVEFKTFPKEHSDHHPIQAMVGWR